MRFFAVNQISVKRLLYLSEGRILFVYRLFPVVRRSIYDLCVCLRNFRMLGTLLVHMKFVVASVPVVVQAHSSMIDQEEGLSRDEWLRN